LKPAERIPLLKRLATALAAIGDEREIDLILRQFGFRIGTLYGNDFYGYALNYLEQSGNDEKRLELERYLEPAADEASARPASSERGPWKIENSVRLFVSHPHSLAPLATSMRDSLGRFLIEAFVAHEDIEPSEKWVEVIESALLTCHAAAALVTPDFRTSAWCDQEIGFCIARSICVVPLLYGPDPHGFLGGFQGAKMAKPTTAYQGGFQAGRKIMDILTSRPELEDRMTPSIVRRYAKSFSYDDTREMIPLLEGIPPERWTPELIDEIEKAPSENDQVRQCNLDGEGVPEVAKRILAKVATPSDSGFADDDDIPF
jgi:hypothetical protein